MKRHESTLRLAHEKSFTFVNLSDPQESAAVIARKIRAQATTYSHSDPSRKQKGSHKKDQLCESTPTVQTRKKPRTRDERTQSFLFASSERVKLLKAAARTVHLYNNPDCGKDDPFQSYPVSQQLPWFGWVLDWYRNSHLPPGIRVVEHSRREGQAYIDWHLREAMNEPSFFYMQLLNACTPLVARGHFMQGTVLWLRGMVIATLNEAIGDPSRMLTIPVLLTVASIALHERLYGDARAALNVHGRAFSRMVSLCGGVEALETPRIGFVLLKFTDDVLSSSNSEKSTPELLNLWAPEEIRCKHPGYESSSESSPDMAVR